MHPENSHPDAQLGIHFLPEEEYVSVPLEAIPLGVPLPFPLYIKVAGKWTCFRAVNDVLTAERVLSLERHRDSVSVPKNNWSVFLDYLERMCVVDSDEVGVIAKNMRTLLVAYGKHLEESKGLEKNAVHKLRGLGIKLADFVYQHPQTVPFILKRYQQSEIYYASHATNVAVYSLAIAQKLTLSLEDARVLSFSCLVHNIGNSTVPVELLYKSGQLTDEEYEKMQSHPKLGSEILEYMDAPSETVLVAKQHHECIDGRGYPRNLRGREIHTFSKICTIADVYDAMISKKPSGKPGLRDRKSVV